MKSRVLLTGFLSLSLFGCSGDGVGEVVTCDQPAPVDEPACSRVGGVVQVMEAAHPGQGVEVVLRVVDSCGGTLPSSYATCLEVPSGAKTAPRTMDVGYTLILTPLPKDADEASKQIATIDAILEARPPTERIGLHAVGMDIVQVSDFTRDRDRLKFLAREALVPTDESMMDLDAAVLESRDVVHRLGNKDEVNFRGVIVVSGSAPGGEAMADGATAIAHIGLGGGADDASAVSDQFDRVMSHGLVGVGMCGVDALSVNGVAMHLADNLPEENGLTCDAQLAAEGKRSFPKRVEFVFNAEERTTWQNLMSVRSRENWATSVKLGDAEAIPAIAHLRGHGTMLCDRKSYSVNLEAPEGGARPLVPGARSDEFFLQSMCWDQMYVENFVYYTILRDLDLFPYKFDYVELIVDGENLGVYLMMEKPHEAVKKDFARPIGVARRNHEGEGDRDEFKYIKEGAENYMKDEYYALITTVQNNSGDTLVTEMRKRLALEHYLRYIAVMTALHNSDYGDEVRFTATERFNTSPNAMWEISAWDPEDVFRNDCVWLQYAFNDPNGLVWCAEGVLENNVLANPTLYAMYVDQLEAILPQLDVEVFDAAAAEAKAHIMPFFQNPEIRDAMVEQAEDPLTTPEKAEEEIDSRLRIIRGRWTDWHQVLNTSLAAYRGL